MLTWSIIILALVVLAIVTLIVLISTGVAPWLTSIVFKTLASLFVLTLLVTLVLRNKRSTERRKPAHPSNLQS
ncbi:MULTISPECIES: hypothetical protein [Oceanospirillaceae]|jgi:hypothetical protein|uniref:Uncharacterized protein n=1 Tax=Oceanobacter antarcticus TaxID=3133425 RepID=A0ABW8NI80_9GAMM|tara:strand:- start:13659 stop:13877 length:219 start_codon:yes stop_codon:yes gene_type:complete